MSRFSLFSSNETKKPKKEQKFTTQKEMLERVGALHLGIGLCDSLTNTWLEQRIKGHEPTYLQNEVTTFNKAFDVLSKQAEMQKQGRNDMRNYAFVETGTPYHQKAVPTSQLVQADGVAKAFEGAPFAAVTIPVKKGKAPHMVGFENDNGEGDCRMFDANLRGGELKGPCADIQEYFALAVERTVHKSVDLEKSPSRVVLGGMKP